MQLGVRLWTVEEYHRMVAAGILHSDERVELIEGQVIPMAAKGTAHAAAITRTARMPRNGLDSQGLVRTQDPIRLDDYSEPEPDVAVVRLNELDYADYHPTLEEIYLLIEVADTSLSRDCETKVKVYAKAGIADYWVLDVNNRQLRVFRSPTQNGYQTKLVLAEDDNISPLLFPFLRVAIQEILPPRVAG